MNLINILKNNKNLLHIFIIGPLFIILGNIKNIDINKYENYIKILLFIVVLLILTIFNIPQPEKTYYFLIQLFHYILCIFIIYIVITNNLNLLFNEYMLPIGCIIIIYHIFLYIKNNKENLKGGENELDETIIKPVYNNIKSCKLEDVIQYKNKWVYHSGNIYDIEGIQKEINSLEVEQYIKDIFTIIKNSDKQDLIEIFNINSNKDLFKDSHIREFLNFINQFKIGIICPGGLQY